MQIETPNPNGLPPEGLKRNQDQPIPAKAPPKPEVTITNPKVLGQMPGPMPSNMAAADAVDKWVKARVPRQNSAHLGSVELSTERRHFHFDQIDQVHATIYEGAPAIVFHYKDSPVYPVHIVIIKLERRDDAIPLAQAIAWRRIQIFPYGKYIQGVLDDLTASPPFNPGQCVDHYFRKRWHAAAKARLAAEQAAIAKPLKDAEDRLAVQASRIAGLDVQHGDAVSAQAAAVAGWQREHDRADFLNRMVYWFAGVFIIIIVIIIVVHHLWPSL